MLEPTLHDRLQRTLAQLKSAGCDVRPLKFAPPAEEEQIRELEAALGAPLPQSFRDVLATVSGHVEFRWFAPESLVFPAPFVSNFSGDLHWSCELIRQFNASKDGWIQSCFGNPDDPYDRVWHDKLGDGGRR